ncbi:hypothetical protein P8C59_007096 [Phyllachora maydis]|uniref:Reverse transcriptase Ty1/copia-type domain-containing protein n=1 Tax=Phyllachora maydis TaxID=1825666 RepID=A0AAD9I816_9PEZI|nr:hypothetical protein P8C59_007096 [Phyllachora maydis]
MADQAKGKGIAPKRASNLADLGQSSRPLPPIRTLSEDKEDSKDYSKVIEVLKQYIKSYKQVIGSQSSDIKTLLLSLNTLKASIEDSVSATKNISSTLASLTNSSNAAATRKTSYKPYLGPAVNSATSNLDPPIDTGSKEGFKDTITSSIVKELSKKAYTIPDDKSKKEDVYNEFHVLTFSTYKKGLSAFNAEFNSYLAKLTIAKIDIDPSLILNYLNIEYLIADILEESRNPAIEAYRAAYIADSSNSTPNSNSNPSKKGKNKKKGKKKASYNIKGQNYSAKSAEQASFMLGSYNLATEEEEEFDSSSNSRYKKRKDFKGKGLKTSSNNKAKYKDNQPRRRPRDPALYNSWLYNTGSIDYISNSKERFTTFTPNIGQLRLINTGNGPVSPAGIGSIISEVLSRKAPPTYTKLVLDNVLYLPNIDINIVRRVRYYDSGGCLIKETLYRGDRRCIAVLDFKKSGFFLDVKGSSKPILYANFAFPLGLTSYNTTKSIEPPIIEVAIVSEAIEPNKRYKLRNSPAKGTTLEGTREPEPLTGTRDLPHVLREPVIEGNKVEKAISSPTLKEPNIGQRDYYNLLNLSKLWHVRLGHIGLCLLKKTASITKGLPNFDKIKEADFHCSSYLIEGDTVKIRPRPYNRNPIVLLLVNRKKRYRAIGARGEAIIPLEKRSKSLKFTSRTEECKLLVVLGSKTYLVYKPSRRAVLKTSTVKFIEDNTVLSQPTNNTALEGELVDLDLDLEGAVSPDPSNLNTEKPISIEIGPSKLESYESSSDSELDKPLLDKPINPVVVESTRPTISIRKPELPEEEIYMEIPEGLLDLAASNKAIYKLLLKYGYNPSTPNIIKLSKVLYSLKQSPREWQDKLKILLKSLGYLPLISDLGVFYNAKTCYFIVTYVDDCLFIGPNIGYITDLKKRLNKVYAIEDLGPAAYFLGMQIIRDRPNRRL